jgi:hypothetical protein
VNLADATAVQVVIIFSVITVLLGFLFSESFVSVGGIAAVLIKFSHVQLVQLPAIL